MMVYLKEWLNEYILWDLKLEMAKLRFFFLIYFRAIHYCPHTLLENKKVLT